MFEKSFLYVIRYECGIWCEISVVSICLEFNIDYIFYGRFSLFSDYYELKI